MDFRLAIAQQILSALPEASLEAADVASMLEVPPDTKLGDYAFPCFKLSKALRKSPVMIADQLAAAIQADFLARVESVRGYLNFFIDRAIYAERVLAAAEAQGDRYGSDDSGAGKCVVMVMHDLALACEAGDRALLLHEGAPLYDGPAAALLASGCVETAFGVRPRPGGVRFERA